MLRRLIERNPGEPGTAAVLTGEAVLDAWPGGVTPQCRTEIVETLLRTMVTIKGVKPTLRSRAGSILGSLGDPRNLEEMVAVPDGPFLMGSNRWDDEKPQHEVQVATFHIAKYPVTNQQYARFVAAIGHEPPKHWQGMGCPRYINNHPVVNVTWHDAHAYCMWLSKVQGTTYRLPTEAEWEKAARGADSLDYATAANPNLNRLAFSTSDISNTSAVGCFPEMQSPYGCQDMAGNVLEWTSSLYEPYPYNPNDGREDPDASGPRAIRSGAWVNYDNFVRFTSRDYNDPNLRSNNVGFRIVAPGS